MKRFLSLSVLLLTSVVVPMGCSPESKQKLESMGQSVGTAAKDAAGDMAKATGMDDMLGKAQSALKSVDGGSEMLKSITDLVGKATSTFKGITNEDTAKAALPDLSKLTESFGGLSDTFGKLPGSAKEAVSGVFSSAVTQLKPLIEKVMAIPGVDAILKPAIEALMEKIGSFKA